MAVKCCYFSLHLLLTLSSRKEEETSTHIPAPTCHPCPFIVGDLTVQAEGSATSLNSFYILDLLRLKGNCSLLSSSFASITAREEEVEKVKMSPECSINLHVWIRVSRTFQAQKALVHRVSYAFYLHASLGCGWHLPGDRSIDMGLSNCSCTCCHQPGRQWSYLLEGRDNA